MAKKKTELIKVAPPQEITPAPQPEVSFEDAIHQLWLSLESADSRRGYVGDWGRYVDWCRATSLDPRLARPRHVQDYMIYLRDANKSKATRGRALSVVRQVYAALCRAEVIASNPAREVKNPKVDAAPKTPWMNEEALGKLLDAVAGDTFVARRDRLCVLLFVGLGKRRAEVARMVVEDFQEGVVSGIVKRNKHSAVGVPRWLLAEITEWTKFAGITSGTLLPRSEKDRRPVSKDIVHDIVRRAAERAGLPEGIGPHAIRRTFITILGEKGVSLKERQLAVSHDSGNTTERYDRARDAAKNAPGELFAGLVKKAKRKNP